MLSDYLPHLTLLALLDTLLIVVIVPVILHKKRDPTVAVAWSLLVILVPLLGAALFWAFGFNYLQRRVARKRTHRDTFRAEHPPASHEATRGAGTELETGPAERHDLARLALAVDAFPVSDDNLVTLYHETADAHEAILQAVREARHHVHLEFYIFRFDATGRAVLDLLAEKARQGVQVRLLVDAVGTLSLRGAFFQPLLRAGGQVREFLPVNLLRSWAQVNLRNHRKIVLADGELAITGGMNIGDEYLGKDPSFGYWRDTMLGVRGPAVAALQRVFVEDWHFATGEALTDAAYFPVLPPVGTHAVQVMESGPDQPLNSVREVYFAAVLAAKRRLWIASPYFVPDGGMLDALRLARLRGVDVRLLCLLRGDHFLSFHATLYFLADMLAAGAKVYQYARGMMHAKVVLVDDDWALVGSPNLDNRSLHLNFEIACALFSPDLIAALEARFLRDLDESRPLSPEEFARRSFVQRLRENACRLFAPIL